ncbi:Aste57867_550 [Aphanomyces stellatus]|uniref:Aste57867_550 protein n=1 Tax=Aphanomyces stellatus TaxID=120398 RepID=A0A485K332_9STRA|nr:hypothetical protein As57867_000549 [Aphanomyces stellatus]VFT77775.1 Aste57867_550 [Aphanomyces stellatus]
MSRVRPSKALSRSLVHTDSSPHPVWAAAGIAYLLFSLLSSAFYLTILTQSLTNDFWWRQFNTTGGQTFLADVFNMHLMVGVHENATTLDLFAESPMNEKDYAASTTLIDVREPAARQWLLRPMSLDVAVKTIRANSLYENMYTLIPYCWVDLDRRFEMAHTAARQDRCVRHHVVTNAALYLETLLRNVGASDLAQSAFGNQIYQTILAPVTTLPGGVAWVKALQTLQWLSVADEVSLWTQSYGLVHYTIQYQNRFQYSMQDAVLIVNALGIQESVKISSIPYRFRGLANWPTSKTYRGVWNDMTHAIYYNASLVRNTSTSFESMGLNWEIEYLGVIKTVGIALVHAVLGPLVSLDTVLIPPPQALTSCIRTFRAQMLAGMRTNMSLVPLVAAIAPPEGLFMDVVPPAWAIPNVAFYGGNPLCFSFASPRSYALAPFSYYDSCQTQKPFGISLDRHNVLFAIVAMAMPRHLTPSVCQLCRSNQQACQVTLANAFDAFSSIDPIRVDSTIDNIMSSLDIEFVQMASVNTTPTFLRQPLLSHTAHDPWSFYGWLTLYDWLDGTREVLYVEGDVGNLTLMSDRVEYLPFAAKPQELPRTACVYFWYLTVYVTLVSGLITFYMLASSLLVRGRIRGTNLFQYNRVVGSVWVGRSILFLRGLTAIVILSTSNAILDQRDGVTYFVDAKRTWIESMVVSGETLWVVYAINDGLLPLTNAFSKEYAPWSSVLGYFAVFCMERIAPFRAAATIQRTCAIQSFRRGIECFSGTVEIGSLSRVETFLGFHVASIGAAYVAVRLYRRWYPHKSSGPGPKGGSQHHVLIPAAAMTFIDPLPATKPEAWCLDSTACIMCGMLPLSHYLFNLNTWTVVKSESRACHSFHHSKFSLQTSPKTSIPEFTRRHTLLGMASLVYMASSIAGSYAFLVLTKSAMLNDFWWANFDSSTHTYLTNWFNYNLQMVTLGHDTDLADAGQGALSTTTNETVSLVNIPPTYSSSIQDEANTIVNVIQSLRNMDGCALPWIMTAYCYVDFNRTWEMANTATKQQRCKLEQGNGAVYLETILRNTQWQSFNQCWGSALNTGIFSFLATSNAGVSWINATLTTSNSVVGEVGYWKSKGIQTFRTQWQNYKSLGVIEFFYIQNAFGWQYPLTSKFSNGSAQLAVQTSFKMQMPLANALTQINSGNTSVQNGWSLIRSSPHFLYANQTPERTLVGSGLLASPLGPGFSLVRMYLGPFGSISMKRVACPLSLQSLYQNLTVYTTWLLSQSRVIQDAFWPIYTSYTLEPAMVAWKNLQVRGGNIQCELDSVVKALEERPGISFSSTGSCSVGSLETLYGDTSALMKAILTVPSPNVTAIAERERFDPASSRLFLQQTLVIVTLFVPPAQAQTFQALAHNVKVDIRDNINVSLIQYLYDGTRYRLSATNFFDLTESDFELYAWLFMFDWVQGIREVVTFQGDVGSLTSLSTSTTFVETTVNPMEVPLHLAIYMRWFLQYITWIMLGVASLVCLYIIGLRGQIEAANMISFSRVTSLVWIGRPMIFLRALSAVCLLATSTLHFTRPHRGLVSYFESVAQPWYMIVLAAGELNWTVYIINDVFSVVTDKCTRGYSITSFNLVWIVSAIWAFVVPPTHVVTLERSCAVIEVDFQLVCSGGTLEIGNVGQFYSLIGLVVGCCGLCYVVERLRQPRVKTKFVSSNFLYAAAKTQFRTTKWHFQGVHYLDKASAVLTGIISLQWKMNLILFDVKTWRIYSIPTGQLGLDDPDLPAHVVCAIPLVE